MNPLTRFGKTITILRGSIPKRQVHTSMKGQRLVLLAAVLTIAAPNIARHQATCTPGPTAAPVIADPSVCEDDPGIAPGAILGWDGDHDAVYAHVDGGYRVRDGKSETISWGIYTGGSHP